MGLPLWVKWFNGWSVWITAATLITALIVLLRTFKKYLKHKMMMKETRRLRTFLIIFTLAYTGVACLVVIAYLNNWDLSSNPVSWPAPI